MRVTLANCPQTVLSRSALLVRQRLPWAADTMAVSERILGAFSSVDKAITRVEMLWRHLGA
jgi:hypothetical protein